jgi:hypothetical protein
MTPISLPMQDYHFLNKEDSAWLGVTITLRSHYDDALFIQCLDVLEKKWVEAFNFNMLCYGKSIESLPSERTQRLLCLLSQYDSLNVCLSIINLLPFNDTSPFDSSFVFNLVSNSVPKHKNQDQMAGYYWNKVCLKLIEWNDNYVLPLLDILLTEMGKDGNLSYHNDISSLADNLVQHNPAGAWTIIAQHFEATLPKWRWELLNWLKGGISQFGEEIEPDSVIEKLPLSEIVKWIELDPEPRSIMIAHAAPKTLDHTGGQLTRLLLSQYGQFNGVKSAVSVSFRYGGWSGSESAYLKRKRNKFRQWLTADFESEVNQWLDSEIECLDKRIEQADIDEERSRFD